MREITQAYQSVVEHKSTERVYVNTKVCRIFRPTERVCVGDQRIEFQFREGLHFEPVKAIHFSTAITSRTPAPKTHPPGMTIPASSPFLSSEASIQLRWISEYGPIMQA